MSGTHPAPVRTSATAEPVLTAERLRDAIAPVPDGYEQILPPKAGSFDRILGSPQDTSDSLSCLRYSAPAPALSSGGEELHNAAAAYVILIHGHYSAANYVKSDSFGETLVALRGAAADRLIGLSIPASCQRFAVRTTRGILQYRLITSEPIHVGSAAGKIIGYKYSVGNRRGQQWLLLFRGPGYLGEVSAAGPTARKKKVVAFARNVYAYAESTLR